ncbi:hypothetical protein [Eubacterium aggregans]|uniref:hypothetical protein n=1 Tax=Eubacterium aggregans TaxID=81409 RepID=UPI003F2AD639
MKKRVFPLCLILFLCLFNLFPENCRAADGDITLTLTVPTAANSTIASGRSFSVQGRCQRYRHSRGRCPDHHPDGWER